MCVEIYERPARTAKLSCFHRNGSVHAGHAESQVNWEPVQFAPRIFMW